MQIFDILNGYKMDGQKRPIRRGFGLLCDFLYKSMSFIGILGCKKRCNSDNVCQNQFKNADDSMIQVGTQSNKIEAYSHTHPEQGGRLQKQAQVAQGVGRQTSTETARGKYFYFKQQGSFQPRIHSEQGRGMVAGLGQLTPLELNTQPEQGGRLQTHSQAMQGGCGQPSAQPEQGRRTVAGLGQLTPLELNKHPEQGGRLQKQAQVAQGVGRQTSARIEPSGSQTSVETAQGGRLQTHSQAIQGGCGQSSAHPKEGRGTVAELGQLTPLESNAHPEQGRSMVEILGVLAVIGVLTVGGIMGYRYAMATYQANEYMNNMRVAYTTINAMPKIPTEATPDILDSFKILEEDVVYYGAADSVFIEAAGVEEKVCQRLLALKTAPIRAIYTVDKDVLTEELCAVKERLLFEFQSDNPNQEVECRLDCGAHGTLTDGCTACVCAAHWGGEECEICDGEWEIDVETGEECAVCPEPYVVQGNACVCYEAGCAEYDENCRCLACKTDFDYVYDAETSTCIAPENLWCAWTYEAGSKADCSFVLLSGNEEQADCAFKIEEASKSDCAFEYNESTEEMTPKGNKCGSGEYCYLKWTDETCDSLVSDTGATTIYGTCMSLNVSKADGCFHVSETVVGSGCSKGEYCLLKWLNKSCGSTITDDGAEIIYGVCTPLNNSSVNDCFPLAQFETPVPCPKGEYCHLNWTDETCDSAVPDIGAETIYGTCTPLNTSKVVNQCLNPVLKEKEGCPDGQYCALKWQQKSCSANLTDTPNQSIYGACVALNKTNAACPIK